MNDSKQKRAAQAAKAARDGTGPTDTDVARALRQVFEKKYAKSWGDKQAAVEAALRFMDDKNCHSFATLTDIVNTGMFAGTKGGMFVEAAVGAYILLQQSLQEKHEATKPPMKKEEKHKRKDDKPTTDEASDMKHDKSQASEGSCATFSESVKLEAWRQGVTENVKAGGTLMDTATQKAAAEMAAQFNYDKLCDQGKQLFEMVLHDKIKRIHSKMQYRLKKKGPLSPKN